MCPDSKPLVRRLPMRDGAPLTFVVIFAAFEQGYVFVRHRERCSWEMPGGHIERGETPLDAARRELYEESGARADKIIPLFDYACTRGGTRSLGRVFFADVRAFDALPSYEMAQRCVCAACPEPNTYPDIQPRLFEWASQCRAMPHA